MKYNKYIEAFQFYRCQLWYILYIILLWEDLDLHLNGFVRIKVCLRSSLQKTLELQMLISQVENQGYKPQLLNY